MKNKATPSNLDAVVSVRGSVVDILFDAPLPPIYSLLHVKEGFLKLLGEQVEHLGSLQRIHYASNGYALLLIFQARDAAGKDGTIRHVMSGADPQVCQVLSFKQPSAEELEHDFLWRTAGRLRNL